MRRIGREVPMKNQRKQGGFSLVELIVAIAIMAIIVLPLLRAFVQSARTNAKAKDRLRATESAQNIMESIEAMSLDDLLDYFTGTPSTILFGESKRERLKKTASGGYVEFSEGEPYSEKSADGKYYFALKGVNGKDFLVSVEANDDALADGESLNQKKIANISAISSDNDALSSMPKTPDVLMAEINTTDPSVSVRDVTRYIDITIEKVTDATVGEYTKVTTDYYLTWAGGRYPVSATDGGCSDVVFDNSDNPSRKLNNVYLFYYPWYPSDEGWSAGRVTDYITINNNAKEALTVYLVKQKEDSPYIQTNENGYRAQVNVVEPMAVGDAVASTKLRTNFNENLYDNSTLMSSQATIALNSVILTGLDADKVSQIDLLAEKTSDRLYNVTIDTYSSGSYNTQFNGAEKLYDDEVTGGITGGMVN
jgi:prepilin-type N-terminal cleavage/methylation domain-containing protein